MTYLRHQICDVHACQATAQCADSCSIQMPQCPPAFGMAVRMCRTQQTLGLIPIQHSASCACTVFLHFVLMVRAKV